jgi:hypothetical protein
MAKGGPKLVLTSLVITGLFLAPNFVYAQSSQAIAQGFKTSGNTEDFVTGVLVSAKQGDSKSVELATSDTVERLIGVIDKDPLLVVSAGEEEAQVVISGSTNVVVSDINGEIHEGDRITASPIAGVGMLATSDSKVIGAAQSGLNIASSRTQTITDSSGRSHEIHIGYVQLQVSVALYQVPGSSFLPAFIQDAANSIAGRQVGLIRVLISSFLAIFGVGSVGIFIYSSVRAAVVSLGRNPLAAPDVRKSLYQIGGIAVAILAGTMLASYLIIAI